MQYTTLTAGSQEHALLPAASHSLPRSEFEPSGTACYRLRPTNESRTICGWKLIPRSRVLLENLTGTQEVSRTLWHMNVRYHIHNSQPDVSSSYSHTTSWRSILILFSHLRLGLPSGLFPSFFPTKTLYTLLLTPRVLSHSLFDNLNTVWWAVRINEITIMWLRKVNQWRVGWLILLCSLTWGWESKFTTDVSFLIS